MKVECGSEDARPRVVEVLRGADRPVNRLEGGKVSGRPTLAGEAARNGQEGRRIHAQAADVPLSHCHPNRLANKRKGKGGWRPPGAIGGERVLPNGARRRHPPAPLLREAAGLIHALHVFSHALAAASIGPGGRRRRGDPASRTRSAAVRRQPARPARLAHRPGRSRFPAPETQSPDRSLHVAQHAGRHRPHPARADRRRADRALRRLRRGRRDLADDPFRPPARLRGASGMFPADAGGGGLRIELRRHLALRANIAPPVAHRGGLRHSQRQRDQRPAGGGSGRDRFRPPRTPGAVAGVRGARQRQAW